MNRLEGPDESRIGSGEQLQKGSARTSLRDESREQALRTGIRGRDQRYHLKTPQRSHSPRHFAISPFPLPLTLAQLMIAPGLQEPPTLPDPPFVEHWLFENPFPLVGILLALAIAIVVFGRERLSPKPLAGIVALLLLLASAAWLTATFVVTDREQIRARARQLVAAVATAKPQDVDPLLSEDAALYAFFTPDKGFSKSEILEMVQKDMTGVYRLHDHTVREVRVLIEGPRVARSHVLVMMDPEESRVQTWSWWRLDWVRDQDQWRVHAIEPISIQGWDRAGRR